MKAATPVFLCCMKMAVAAPKAHAEWVDGKDELDGLETSSAKSRSIWQGRGLEIKFFSTSCPIRNTAAVGKKHRDTCSPGLFENQQNYSNNHPQLPIRPCDLRYRQEEAVQYCRMGNGVEK